MKLTLVREAKYSMKQKLVGLIRIVRYQSLHLEGEKLKRKRLDQLMQVSTNRINKNPPKAIVQ